jgi:hypothetical protein
VSGEALIRPGGADSDVDLGKHGLDGGRLSEITDAGDQALGEIGAEAAEELLQPTASAPADPHVGVGVSQEILDEKRTEISAGAHDQDAGRRRARHGAVIVDSSGRPDLNRRPPAPKAGYWPSSKS